MRFAWGRLLVLKNNNELFLLQCGLVLVFVNCIVIDETTMTHGVGETAPLIVASSDVYFGIQGPDNFAAGRTFETAFNACLPDGKPYLGEMSVEYSIGKKL